MAIEDELSSDIAIALLAGKKSGPELNDLKEVVLKIHASLHRVSNDSYTNRASFRPHNTTSAREHAQRKAGEENKSENF